MKKKFKLNWMYTQMASVLMVCLAPVVCLLILLNHPVGEKLLDYELSAIRMYALDERVNGLEGQVKLVRQIKNFERMLRPLIKSSRRCQISALGGRE